MSPSTSARLVNAGDNVANAGDQVTIRITARVLDLPINVNGRRSENDAQATIASPTDPTGARRHRHRRRQRARRRSSCRAHRSTRRWTGPAAMRATSSPTRSPSHPLPAPTRPAFNLLIEDSLSPSWSLVPGSLTPASARRRILGNTIRSRSRCCCPTPRRSSSPTAPPSRCDRAGPGGAEPRDARLCQRAGPRPRPRRRRAAPRCAASSPSRSTRRSSRPPCPRPAAAIFDPTPARPRRRRDGHLPPDRDLVGRHAAPGHHRHAARRPDPGLARASSRSVPASRPARPPSASSAGAWSSTSARW